MIIVQANELERRKVYPLLKGGVYFRIVIVIAPPIITRGKRFGPGPPVSRKQQNSPFFTQMVSGHHQDSEQLKPEITIDKQKKRRSLSTPSFPLP